MTILESEGAIVKIVSELEKIVGPDRVSTSEAVCLTYSYGCFIRKRVVRKPDIVVMPQTPEEVSEIIKAANRHNVPVTPKGATGAGGHTGPLRGGILLDLSLMDRIIRIDVDDMKAVAEARLPLQVQGKGAYLGRADAGGIRGHSRGFEEALQVAHALGDDFYGLLAFPLAPGAQPVALRQRRQRGAVFDEASTPPLTNVDFGAKIASILAGVTQR